MVIVFQGYIQRNISKMPTSRIYTCIVDESIEEVDEDSEPTFSVYSVPDRRDEGQVKEISICPQCKSILVAVCREVFDNKMKEYGKKKRK